MIRWPTSILAVLTSMASAQTAPVPEPFDVAVTVDDLPAHGPLPPGETRLKIAQAYLKTLKAHRVPEAYGFVNAGRTGPDPASDAVLAAWRKAGYPLGNHGYEHLNLDRAPSLAAWEADVAAGEPIIARHMAGANWHVFRFPNLAAGRERERHDGAAVYLARRNYRVAEVSIAFSDWSYSDAYVRCLAKGDDDEIRAMTARYLRGVDREISWMRAVSQRVYGRMVPQVLLTHVGAWSSATLPAVLARLEAAGARYVTLAEAGRDNAYAEAGGLPGGGGIMERTAAARNMSLSDIPRPEPLADLKALCR